ncbi:MAG: sigma-70 family RNA polymerase sigma factor [Acidimicrobiia bacterium]
MTARPGTIAGVEVGIDDLDRHRKELTGYCYRMLGSASEADDAVQETIVKAWKNLDGFEGRSALRSWLYRIATNVCLDMLRGRQRRATPMDLGPSSKPEAFRGETRPGHAWLEPVPDDRVLSDATDPAEAAAARESIRLAFVAALQHLPARQRAALILCEVLRWQAAEVADLLDTSVAAVNSALQRARATLATRAAAPPAPALEDPEQQALLARYVDAFERYDITSLVGLLRDDAIMSMPPFDFWIEGPDLMAEWFLGHGSVCRGSRLVPTWANGCPAYGSYHADPAGGHSAWAIQVIETDGDRIVAHHNFVDPSLFAGFGLPLHLPAGEGPAAAGPVQ